MIVVETEKGFQKKRYLFCVGSEASRFCRGSEKHLTCSGYSTEITPGSSTRDMISYDVTHFSILAFGSTKECLP